jgi:hypothetical protein
MAGGVGLHWKALALGSLLLEQLSAPKIVTRYGNVALTLLISLESKSGSSRHVDADSIVTPQ